MTLPQTDGLIWLNGEFIKAEDAKVHVMTHTLHYGSGVFEGVRAYKTNNGTAIFRLHGHTKRLFDSAKILGMTIPYSYDEMIKVQIDAVKKNNLQEAYIRPLIFNDHSSLGLRIKPETNVHAMVAVWKWGAYLGDDQLKNGIRAKFSSFVRQHPNAAFTKAKSCGQYIICTQASQEVARAGYDEALMLDTEGYVSEASSANFFMVRNGVLITPPADNCLEGVTRDSVIRLAMAAGYEVQQRRITRDETYIADEAFLSGTAVEITPIREIDDRAIGNGKPGPITCKLKELFYDQVYCRNATFPDWSVLI